MKRVAAIGFLLSAVVFASGCTSPPDAKGASVLLITIDTLRADRVGAYGSSAGLTPNIDGIAGSGVVFDEALTSVPLTLPSHATILTGLDPLHHGVRNNGQVLPASQETLATRLKTTGYATAAFVSAVVLDHRFGLARGFDVYDDQIPRAEKGRSTLESERPCTATVKAATSWIRSQTAHAFVWVHMYEPHAPYESDEGGGESAASAYGKEVRRADQCVGELKATISRDTARRWLLVIASDHGEGLGEHGESTHGLFLYQSTLRVPLVIHGPSVPQGERRSGLARTASIAPTVLRRLGLEVPRGLDGRDLFAREPVNESYAETDYPTGFGWAALRSWRLGSLKMISGPQPELFDLGRDPGEATNLAVARGDDVSRLQNVLNSALKTEVKPDTARVSREVEEKLRSLGYVAGAPRVGESERGARDPKAALPLFHQFESAMDLEAKGDVAASAQQLTALVAKDPSNLTFKRSLASALLRSGQGESAVRVLRDASKLAPQDAAIANDLSVALDEQGSRSEAVRESLRATTLDPAFGGAWDHLATLRVQAGDLKDALEAADRAVAIDSNNARAWTNRGNILNSLSEPAPARECYERALKIDPDFVDALNGLGVLAVGTSDWNAAAERFYRVLELEPRFDQARLSLAFVEFQRGRKDKASELASAVADHGSNSDLRKRALQILREIH